MKYLLPLLLFLAACTLHPKYCRPIDVDIPCQWRIQPDEISCDSNSCWWTLLQDPVLNDLVAEALNYNQDIKTAIYRVEQFIAQLGISRSQLYPQISGQGTAIRQKQSATTVFVPISPGQPTIENLYTLVLNGSYYLDIWGLIRSSNEVALHQLLSQMEVRKTVVLTVVSAVATSYIRLRQFDMQLTVAKETLQSRYDTLKLTDARYNLGEVGSLDVQQAKSQLSVAQTTIEQLKINIGLEEDLLSILVGHPPTTICRGAYLTEIVLPPSVPTFFPSDLLNQRPEILAAEQSLIAANAQIGVARAQFFPQISLNGAYGTQSSFIHDLFNSRSSIWQYGVSLMQEIFTGGKLTNQLRLAEAQKQTLLHEYQQAILNGFKEVNDALIAHTYTLKLVEEQKAGVAALTELVKLSTDLYKGGETDYLTLLDAERQLFASQLTYVQYIGDSFTTLIQIYQALGGGWVVDADDFSTQMEYCEP